MKKIVVLFSIMLIAALSWGIAAEEKESSASSKATAATEHKILSPSELTWAEAPPGLPPGAKMAVLDGDPTKPGLFTVRLQTTDGYKIPPHTHPTAELLTVISGTLHLGTGDKFDESAGRELTPGSFGVMPAGMKHFGWVTGETIVQIHGMGPFKITYVNPADDPPECKKITRMSCLLWDSPSRLQPDRRR